MKGETKFKELWVNLNHSCQMGEIDVVYSEAESKKYPGYTFTHVIEKSGYDQLKARLAEAERVIEQIAKVDAPRAADKTAWIVMLESVCALCRNYFKPEGK